MSTDLSNANAVVFGSRERTIEYVGRRAAYVVIIVGGEVAMVGYRGTRFLPGGGSLPDEDPETTVAREVREELGLSVRLLNRIGEATQYFYSDSDGRHYEMRSVFFAGEFTNRVPNSIAEHQLEWWPVAKATALCFHECHAWAVRESQDMAPTTVGPELRERFS
jgi:8-oxo-dGTP pyrophosphatase MutT (NUDIX family)